MTTDEALTRLRADWSLSKDDDYRTDEPGWAVHSLMNGEIYKRLGWGRTPVEAIDAAEAQMGVNERGQAERDADYARRKAAGQLTALEKASDRAGALWTTAVLAEIDRPSILAGLVNRAYGGRDHRDRPDDHDQPPQLQRASDQVSLLDAARKLADLDAKGPDCRCVFCGRYICDQWQGECASPHPPSQNHPHCVTQYLPGIVAALEAAERLIAYSIVPYEEPATDDDGEYVFCGLQVGGHECRPRADCPWQALVAALDTHEPDPSKPKAHQLDPLMVTGATLLGALD